MLISVLLWDGLIPAGWSRDTESTGQWQVQCMRPFIPLSGPGPALGTFDSWYQILSEREARAHCPTWTPSLHDTVQTLTIHTEPYLSTYHRNPTVHFYLFSSSYHLISYWDQPPTRITISNRLVTSFLCASDCHNVGELDNSNYFRQQARVSSVQCQY